MDKTRDKDRDWIRVKVRAFVGLRIRARDNVTKKGTYVASRLLPPFLNTLYKTSIREDKHKRGRDKTKTRQEKQA